MTFTYNGLPGTSDADARRDAVRLLCQDTDDTTPLLQDEEIAFFLDQENNAVYRAAALGCDVLSRTSQQTRTVGDLSISGQTGDFSALAKRYRLLADSGATPFAGGISVSDKATRAADTDRVAPAFTRSLHVTPGIAIAAPPGTS